MRTIKEFKMCSLRIVLFTILLSGLSVNEVYSYYMEKRTVPMDGRWEKNEEKVAARSLPSIPITAYMDGQNIYIENNSPDCDIQVSITSDKTGEVMFEQLMPEIQTGYIVISIANFPSGKYKLELTGEAENYLIGDFYK